MPDDTNIVKLTPPKKNTELFTIKPTWEMSLLVIIKGLESKSEKIKQQAIEDLYAMARRLDEFEEDNV